MDFRALAIDATGRRGIALSKGKLSLLDSIPQDHEGPWLLPPLVDLGVGVLDGRLSQRSLRELARKARQGGVGTILLRPDLSPPLNDEIHLEFIKSTHVQVELYPAILATRGEGGLSEIATLAKLGARAIFVESRTDSSLLAPIFQYAQMLQLPLFVWIDGSRRRGVMNEGEVAFQLGLRGRSKVDEYGEVARIVEYGDYYGVPVIIGGISTARSLELIAQSPHCFAQLSIHHLLKSDRAALGYNTLAKLDPPLRDQEEQEALLEALGAGKVDLLTALHTPASYTRKDLSFDEAAYGIDSIASYLPLAYTKLVLPGHISMERLLQLASATPAKLIGLERGTIAPEAPGPYLLFDPRSLHQGEGLYRGEEIYGTIEYLEDWSWETS
ncbi:MAG: hypothetical protein C6I00_03825 [Nitratiruptor sp.]|nr:hypothetical protein [Nitratiruptor sp.]NPA83911.1 hypothetical protein [Campylobacterota bacterium]